MVVAGGSVSITNLGSKLTQATVTDQQGRFSFAGVLAGRYRVVANGPGFGASTRTIVVTADQTAAVEFTLKIAAASTLVVVEAPAVTVGSDTITPARSRTSDTAALLEEVPGVSLNINGGISSLPAIHGLADDRVKTLVDGMTITAHCANHMNPALSYIAPGNVESINVLAGITPVSEGGDSIGGTIAVDSPIGEFANSGQGWVTHGSLSGYHRSNGVVNGGDASLSGATEHFSALFAGSYVNAGNYHTGDGLFVKSSLFEARNDALTLAARHGQHLFSLRLGYQYLPEQGFPNDSMDMTKNDGRFVNARYQGKFDWGKLDARFYYENTGHEMNILSDRMPGMYMPMTVQGGDLGYTVKAEHPLSAHDVLRVGTELHRSTLNDWWPPVAALVGAMGPNTFWNVRDGRRYRFGTYPEWETVHGQKWTGLLGIRNDEVLMNTGNVAGYNMSPTVSGSAAYYADATAFNARNHSRGDNNFDLTALGRYRATANSTLELGYARKTRSPSLYERYLWVKNSPMAVDMNGWFGDGNGYTGNLDLRPEVAHTVSATADWHDSSTGRWELKITPYYTYVQDYIGVRRCPIVAGSTGCSAARFYATSGYVTLQFANQDAQLFGVDASGRLPLGGNAQWGDFALTGVLSYVRGKNLSTGGNLYNIMPVNLRLTLEHRRGHWSNGVALQAVDSKRDVEAVRNELRTAGYAVVNLRSGYQWHIVEAAELRFDAGIDNLANRTYALPLGGRYWDDTTGSTQVPGYGRTFFGGFTFRF